MWTIRDSDGIETLHSIYPSWAAEASHLTVIPYVPKASLDAVVAELADVQKQLNDAQKFAKQHMRTLRAHQSRMREIEASNNKYYSLLQRYGLCQEQKVDDSPIISVKV
jgi:hypothetical protein